MADRACRRAKERQHAPARVVIAINCTRSPQSRCTPASLDYSSAARRRCNRCSPDSNIQCRTHTIGSCRPRPHSRTGRSTPHRTAPHPVHKPCTGTSADRTPRPHCTTARRCRCSSSRLTHTRCCHTACGTPHRYRPAPAGSTGRRSMWRHGGSSCHRRSRNCRGGSKLDRSTSRPARRNRRGSTFPPPGRRGCRSIGRFPAASTLRRSRTRRRSSRCRRTWSAVASTLFFFGGASSCAPWRRAPPRSRCGRAAR